MRRFWLLGVGFESLGVRSWPLVADFSASRCRFCLGGSTFGFWKSNLGSGVDFRTLWKLMLSIWESILELWESFLALKGKCMIVNFEVMHLGVDYGLLGDNFWPP